MLLDGNDSFSGEKFHFDLHMRQSQSMRKMSSFGDVFLMTIGKDFLGVVS